MPSFDSMIESKYLKKDDFPRPALLTLARFERENVGQEGKPEFKWVAYFVEQKKGMVLNALNLQLMKLATGVTGSEAAIGKKIVVFVDPTVQMGGRIVGGLRIRAPRSQPAGPVPPVDEPALPHVDEPLPADDPTGDDVPF